MLYHFELFVQGKALSCYAFAIKIVQWKWMSLAKLSLLVRPRPWSCSCLKYHLTCFTSPYGRKCKENFESRSTTQCKQGFEIKCKWYESLHYSKGFLKCIKNLVLDYLRRRSSECHQSTKFTKLSHFGRRKDCCSRSRKPTSLAIRQQFESDPYTSEFWKCRSQLSLADCCWSTRWPAAGWTSQRSKRISCPSERRVRNNFVITTNRPKSPFGVH